MTSSPSSPKVKVDFGYTLSVSVDFEADLSVGKSVKIPLRLPLAGTWSLEIVKEDTEDIHCRMRYGQMEVGFLGSSVIRRMGLYWTGEGTTHEIWSAFWPECKLPRLDDEDNRPFQCFRLPVTEQDFADAATRSHGLYTRAAHRNYRVTCEIASSCPQLESRSEYREDYATHFHLEQLPSQVRLFFPNLRKDGTELWASSDVLSKTVPYFRDLLTSDFSEATPRRSKRARKSGAQPLPPPPDAEKDFEDSDDETDAFLLTNKPPKLSESIEGSEVSFREVTITQTAFSTYHALLVYLETGFVHFAPLRSASKPSNPAASSTRPDFLSQKLKDKPSLPLPVSPKSLFRLADLLRLPDDVPLSALCLRAISDSLTHHGAALELFSDTSQCFDKVRKVVLDYVVENWDGVSEKVSWKEMLEKIKRDEVPGAGGVMVELMLAREEAAKAKVAKAGDA
ncbi:hypothetical protein JCM6882_005576 [Rhodosporidiobolus microsporus]